MYGLLVHDLSCAGIYNGVRDEPYSNPLVGDGKKFASNNDKWKQTLTTKAKRLMCSSDTIA